MPPRATGEGAPPAEATGALPAPPPAPAAIEGTNPHFSLLRLASRREVLPTLRGSPGAPRPGGGGGGGGATNAPAPLISTPATASVNPALDAALKFSPIPATVSKKERALASYRPSSSNVLGGKGRKEGSGVGVPAAAAAPPPPPPPAWPTAPPLVGAATAAYGAACAAAVALAAKVEAGGRAETTLRVVVTPGGGGAPVQFVVRVVLGSGVGTGQVAVLVPMGGADVRRVLPPPPRK